MIQGVIASQFPPRAVAGGGGAIPAGSLLFLDFVNRVYAVNGVEVTVGSVIDRTDLVGVSGLELRYDAEITPGTESPKLLGAALAAVLTFDWTVVLEYDVPNDSYATYILVTGNFHGSNPLKTFHGGPFDPHYFFVLDDRSGFEDTSVALTTGVNRVAITRQATRRAMSVNGQAVVTDERDAAVPPDGVTATFGGFPDDYLNNEFNFRSLTLYAAQLDAALPALSSP